MKKIFLTTIAALIAFNAYAVKAATSTDCATLGYVNTSIQCLDKPILKCPFDNSKIYCGAKENTCEGLGYFSNQANDKVCTYINAPGSLSCYTNCEDAPACSAGLGKGLTSANARIDLLSQDIANGTCTFKEAGNCTYAGFSSSSPRATSSDFGKLLTYFSGSFNIYSVGTTCGNSMTGYKIENNKICVAWNEPQYGSTCSSAGASSIILSSKKICYKCVDNTSSGASGIANYVCYQSSGNVVNSFSIGMEICTATKTLPRNSI